MEPKKSPNWKGKSSSKLQTIIFRFHVHLPGCTTYNPPNRRTQPFPSPPGGPPDESLFELCEGDAPASQCLPPGWQVSILQNNFQIFGGESYVNSCKDFPNDVWGNFVSFVVFITEYSLQVALWFGILGWDSLQKTLNSAPSAKQKLFAP